MIIICDDFNLPAVDAALGIDVVGSELRPLADCLSDDGGFLADDADLDRTVIGGANRSCRCQQGQHPGGGQARRKSAYDICHGSWISRSLVFLQLQCEYAVSARQSRYAEFMNGHVRPFNA